MTQNLFSNLPTDKSVEHFEDIIKNKHIRIERITSYGQRSPDSFWYNQTEHEWVTVLEGEGTIEFEGGVKHTLKRGDYINIPAHTKHRVSRTAANETTLWLAVFYKD